MTSLLLNFPFSLKTRIPEKLALFIQNKGDMKVNPTEKGTEKYMMLKRKTFPGLYEDILNSLVRL